jgi:DNA-binding NtrC family response regulator
MQRARILIVDDEANARTALAELLKEEGYSVDTAADGFKALGKMDDFAPDLVLTDLKMPGMDGLELLRKVQARAGDTVVVVMTAFGAIETAVGAMRNGAADYLTKPLNMSALSLVLARQIEHQRLRRETGHLKARLAEKYSFANLIGQSAVMQEVFKTAGQVAESRASVLITGASGTGKEVIASAIHEHSPRRAQPFVKLHCAALPETLLESELFGHERGAFAGATARRDGRLLQADKGTLFLDEIGEIPPSTQVKLLRFLQEHTFERVGGHETQRVDVRIIAATHRDLKAEVASERFREDLFYRLSVVNIDMPPLHTHTSDIPLLASHFLRKYAAENGRASDRTILGFSDEALECLVHYPWPGNVRELENTIERAVVLCQSPRIGVPELPPHIRPATGRGIQIPGSTLEQIENHVIRKTLEHTGGSTSRAAEILGISVRKVQYKLHEYQDAPKSGAPVVSISRPDRG